MDIQYTVKRCRKDGTMFGSVHGSRYAYRTICGKEINRNWFILTNSFDGKVTCKECIKSLENGSEWKGVINE